MPQTLNSRSTLREELYGNNTLVRPNHLPHPASRWRFADHTLSYPLPLPFLSFPFARARAPAEQTCDGEAFQCSERMRRIPAEVAINVEQHVESAQAEAVDFRELRRSRRSAAVAHGDVKTGLDEDDAEVDIDIDEARSYVSDAK